MTLNRKSFGAVLDETVSQMEHDVRALKTQQVTLKTNIKELQDIRDKLSDEIVKLEEQYSTDSKENEEKISSLMETAKEKLSKASLKESEVSGKLSELNEKIKKCNNLIKSNEGSRNNLGIQRKELDEKTLKLSDLLKEINEI